MTNKERKRQRNKQIDTQINKQKNEESLQYKYNIKKSQRGEDDIPAKRKEKQSLALKLLSANPKEKRLYVAGVAAAKLQLLN